jgi:anhydro-N-acetylmuramic acid kinase
MKIAGIMTGTSCDGLDISCVQFHGGSWNPLWSRSAPYPAPLRKRVLDCQIPGAKLSLREYGELHRDLGIWIANTVSRIAEKIPSAQRPDAIANHGQTVAHFPAARKQGFTIQLADPTRIAAATGLTVISNFRDGDIAVGGEGAPLAPRFHQLLARRISKKPIAIHNLGGISNLTLISGGATLAFDTGPGNAWIDAATELAANQRYDKNGALASRGQPASAALKKILAMDYFHRPPPKSTGRDDFPFSLLLKSTRQRDANLIATATAITAESIVRAYEDLVMKRHALEAIYFCGGGAQNKFLLESIRRRLPSIRVATLDEVGFDSRYLEAQAFAYFGYLTLRGLPLGGPWTGARGWAPAAHVIPGRDWPKIVQKLAGEVGATAPTRAKSKSNSRSARKQPSKNTAPARE